MRVVLFNDSPTVRANLVAALQTAGDAEVVGVYGDAAQAVQRIRADQPDVVLMDVVMPGKDGYAATREILAVHPVPIVLVSAVVDTSAASVVLEALASGALCIVDAPPGPASPEFRVAAMKFAQLVRTMATANLHRVRGGAAELPPVVVPSRMGAVAIVASAGGPAALVELFDALPRGMPPVLLVQHLPPSFVRSFAGWLSDRVGRPVVVAVPGATPQPDHLYVAPPDLHLVLAADGSLGVSSEPPSHGFRPSGSVLLRSVAEVLGRRAVGVVLTGMGADGSDGAAALRRSGGAVVAQSRESAAVFGMPAAAVAAGGVDVQLPLEAIGPWLARRAGVQR